MKFEEYTKIIINTFGEKLYHQVILEECMTTYKNEFESYCFEHKFKMKNKKEMINASQMFFKEMIERLDLDNFNKNGE